MPFDVNEYEVCIVLTSANSMKPWSWQMWGGIQEVLEPFSSSVRGETAIRTTQIDRNDGRRKISFGRLGWNEKSARKWTHDSPETEAISKDWQFLGAEAWGPSWTSCEKERASPNFYLSLTNGPPYGTGNTPQIGAVIIMALSVFEGDERLAQFRRAAARIADQFESPLSVCKRRTWGRQYYENGISTNALNDIGVVGLFKARIDWEIPIDLSILAEPWNLLERGGSTS